MSLPYRFQHPELLEQALTHPSAAPSQHERLEFLGDALLNAIIAIELFHRFPEASEGELSRLRSTLVRGETLAGIAEKLALPSMLRLGRGEKPRPSILANALEAVIGAVYLDGGFEACRRFVLTLFEKGLKRLSLEGSEKDPKTRLQEYLQKRGLPLPEYRVVEVTGPPHARVFRVQCLVQGLPPATGEGPSRRKAEQEAARKVLEALEHG
ncbi:MAG: ribonuclease III [Gammaproteobacteria bacterium]|nr:MAG: ribonuclease III [Gammaproteobacteria bacterium]